MHFATRKDAHDAADALRELTLTAGEHTVRQLEPDEAGTAYKCMSHTIKPRIYILVYIYLSIPIQSSIHGTRLQST